MQPKAEAPPKRKPEGGERKAPGTPNMKKKCDDGGDTPDTAAAKKERIDRSIAPAKTSSQTNHPKTVRTRNRQAPISVGVKRTFCRTPPGRPLPGRREEAGGKAEAATSESPKANPEGKIKQPGESSSQVSKTVADRGESAYNIHRNIIRETLTKTSARRAPLGERGRSRPSTERPWKE